MAKRPAHTLIFLGSNRTDRADFGDAPKFPVLSQYHEMSQGSDDPVTRVEALLASSSRIGKQVWILWEGAGSQILEIPAAVTNGLEQQQLADVLSFEAEALTGVPATDSAIDGIPQRNAPGALAEFRRYWITQFSAAVRTRLDEVLTRAGAKLGGVAHPGGLPRDRWDGSSAASPEAIREWRRIEIWDQLTFSLHGRTDGTVETRVIRSAPGSEAWIAELPTEGPLSWMGPGPVSRVSPGGQRVPDALTPLNVDGIPLQPTKVDLPPDVPVEWLRAWAAELTAKTRRIPVVGSFSQVSPNRKYYLVGAALTSLALAVCGGHAAMLITKTTDARTRADRVESLRAQMSVPDTSTSKEEAAINAEATKLRSSFKDLDQKRAVKEADYAKAEKISSELIARQTRLLALQAIHRPALSELLAALADSDKTENVSEIVVKEVRQEKNGDLRLTGLCRKSASADSFATKIQKRLSTAGWRVAAAQKQLRADGLAFDFSIVLTPVVLSDSYADGHAPPSPATAPTGSVGNVVQANPAPSGVRQP